MPHHCNPQLKYFSFQAKLNCLYFCSSFKPLVKYKNQSTTKFTPIVKIPIAAAGRIGVKAAVISYWAYWISSPVSLTIDPQSAVGGWMPTPKKESDAIIKNT